MGSFEILAEVAIGIAGFGSLAIVLGRDREGWESADAFRTAGLFLASLGGLFLALLPIGLATTQLAATSIWRASSGPCCSTWSPPWRCSSAGEADTSSAGCGSGP